MAQSVAATNQRPPPPPQLPAQPKCQQNKTLINEAIKRILLDIVVRGHGDRLIGRWSRDPDVQTFLEGVPYMLDRINQLHLACMRLDQAQDKVHHHQHHHHHHHHRHHHQHHAPQQNVNSLNSSLHEFVSLIGVDQLDSNAWLVRTRDSLGLTPLHKAVLFHNRPISEFILDRYPDELAASSSSQAARSQTSVRLIDAQDKYGRSALHYAAPSCANTTPEDSQQQQQRQQTSNAFDFYRFLIRKGASTRVRDFRGKTPDYYAKHPVQLRAKSIIHLANKLNVNYQATVLSRTLRAMTFRSSIDFLAANEDKEENESLFGDDYDESLASLERGQHQDDGPSENRESMSVSCANLSSCGTLQRGSSCGRGGGHFARTKHTSKSLTNLAQEDLYDDQEEHNGNENEFELVGLSMMTQPPDLGSSCSNGALRSSSLCSSPITSDRAQNHLDEPNLKLLLKERSPRMILDDKKRLQIRRNLNEGKIDQINQLLVEGYGGQLLDEAPITCWNQHCRHYVLKIVPNLLNQLDALHELIATNQFTALRKMLEQSHPILVRIRRPYKRAAMNALHLAVQLNRKTIVGFLLERYPELVGQVDSNGATCLHLAARSLHNDRLYCWLSEHYGAQLESLCDDRNKTAADYRQQAIRLASFDDRDQPSRGDSSSLIQQQQLNDRANFRSIMNKQQTSERELEVRGARENLANRPRNTHKRRASPKRDANPVAERNTESQVVRIGVESPSTFDGSVNELGSLLEEGSSNQPNDVPLNCAPIDGTKRSNSKEPADQNKDQITDHSGQISSLEDIQESAQSKQVNEEKERCQLLSNELVQLDANENELQETDVVLSEQTKMRNSGKGRSSDQITNSGDADDLSIKKGRNLAPPIEEIIRKCIVTNNLKKLEHLILAGCGARIRSAYEELLSLGNSDHEAFKVIASTTTSDSAEMLVSAETRDFIERHALGLMQTIEQIHETLHKCYSHVTASLPTATTINLMQTSDGKKQHELGDAKNGTKLEAETGHVIEFMNLNFHKLCSLLANNWFIMARDKFGACPIHVALVRSDKRLLDYLLRRDPNAASAPDHENRNALHYAALVLTAFEQHGPMKLIVGLPHLASNGTTGGGESNNDNERGGPSPSSASSSLPMGAAQAHWLVDSTSRLLYDNLCSRYGDDLDKMRDRYGKTHKDYRKPSENDSQAHNEHIKMSDLPDGLYQAELVRNCCKDFAAMLKRYNYLIWVGPSVESAASQILSRQQSQEPGNDRDVLRRTQKDSFERDIAGRSDSETIKNRKVRLDMSGQTSNSVSSQNDKKVLQHAGNANFNAKDPSTHPIEPHNHLPDCRLPVDLILGTSLKSASLTGDVTLSPQSGASSTPKSRRHHHRNSRNRRASSARHSIVGGVIVPTIIHNDKMDEIETYDIIYRQPPSPRSPSSSSSSSSSSLTSSSISLNNELGGASQPVIDDQHLSKQLTKTLTKSSPSHGTSNNHHHHHHKNHADKFALSSGANLLPTGTKHAPNEVNDRPDMDSPGSSSSSDEAEDRVERLSNEFETRVRREKNELRAKVDQIMKEIKLSAKSSKSSRFLSSPNDLTALTLIKATEQNQPMCNTQTNKPKSSIASISSKATNTTSDSSCSSPSIACSNSQCNSAVSSLSMGGHNRQARTSSCSSASTTASSSSAASSPIAAKGFLVSKDVQKPVLSRAASNNNNKEPNQQEQNQQQSQLDLLQQQQQHHLSELAGQLVSKNTYGQTYLHFIASRSQGSSTFYKVLEHGNHLVAERDVFYRTARDVALQFNLPNNVQLLDKFIIDLFVQGRMQLLWTLLRQGYSPLIHVSDPDGNDIMLILKLLKRDSMICYLLQMADFQRWRDELHTFIRNNYISGAIELIKKHKDLVRAKSVYARTSLHLAVLFDRIEMVNELIKTDPTSVHVVDNMGRTPLHYAFGLHLKNGDLIREKLIASGSQLDFRDVRQRTPKYYYIFRREIEEIRRIEMELN